MTVIPVITFVKGDAKSGDTLVSRFGGKKLHSQGTQDVFVWQGGSRQPTAQMPMDPNGIPKRCD
jgi:hypothetical protein